MRIGKVVVAAGGAVALVVGIGAGPLAAQTGGYGAPAASGQGHAVTGGYGAPAAPAAQTGGYGAPAGAKAQTGGYGAPAAPAAQLPGVVVRESKVQGYALTYRLLSWAERNAAMKGMEGMSMPGMDASGKATNHLMLYVKGPDGKAVAGATVGFILTGPDKAEQKTLTMAMGGGYGADVTLKAKGGYAIRTKVVAGAVTLTEDFSYTVK